MPWARPDPLREVVRRRHCRSRTSQFALSRRVHSWPVGGETRIDQVTGLPVTALCVCCAFGETTATGWYSWDLMPSQPPFPDTTSPLVRSDGGTVRLLVVDDEPDLTEVLCGVFAY